MSTKQISANHRTAENVIIAIIMLLIPAVGLGVPVGIWVLKSKMEASAYNRITHANISTWDAMWVELRVTP
jgi:hypothetical protein